MRIVSWNMNRLGRSESSHEKAWNYLRQELQADLCLVQEASPPDHLTAKTYRPIGAKPYNWGSAVVALRSDLVLQGRRRVPLHLSLSAAVAEGELPDSHPGASAVADVLVNGRCLFTAVSLYTQWEMMPGGKTMYAGPRLHRMLSDLTGILALAHRKPVVLAGDLNITTQGAQSADNEASAAFHRLRAWQLVDCIINTRESRQPTTPCKCPDGDHCAHVRTFRTGSQLDYVFASKQIVHALTACVVKDVAAAWELSDHCPIVVDLDEARLTGISSNQALGWQRSGGCGTSGFTSTARTR
jgi:exonuclease III